MKTKRNYNNSSVVPVIFTIFILLILPSPVMAGTNPSIDAFGKELSSLFQSKDYDKIILMCNKAIETNEPKFKTLAPVYYARGCALYEKADYDNAISDFEAAVKIKKDYGHGYYMLSFCYQKKGQVKEAIDAIRNGQLITPSKKLLEKRHRELIALRDKLKIQAFQKTPLGQSRMKYKPFEENKYLLNAPIDDSNIKGEFMEWVGKYNRKVDGFYIAAYNSTYHPNIQWAFVNTQNKDLTKVSEYVRCIGKYVGRTKFKTVIGDEIEIPVLEAYYIE